MLEDPQKKLLAQAKKKRKADKPEEQPKPKKKPDDATTPTTTTTITTTTSSYAPTALVPVQHPLSSSLSSAAAAANAAANAVAASTAPAVLSESPNPTVWPTTPFSSSFSPSFLNPLVTADSGQIHVLDEKHDPVATSEDESLSKKPRDVFQSVVECGQVDNNGVRRMTAFSPFFGKEVQIYTAVNDPEKRTLYRASALAEKFNCATNKIGMYLARRRNGSDGIFQATRFKTKPSGRTGLKAGGYFISFAACKAFEAHYKQQGNRKSRPTHHGSEDASGQFGSYFANLQYANPLLGGYLGYGGGAPNPMGSNIQPGGFSQFQQQLYMYNQLAKMNQRVAAFNNPAFKTAPHQPQFSPQQSQFMLTQLQQAKQQQGTTSTGTNTTAAALAAAAAAAVASSGSQTAPEGSYPKHPNPSVQPASSPPQPESSAASAAAAAVAAASAAASGSAKPAEGGEGVATQLRAYQHQMTLQYLMHMRSAYYHQQMYGGAGGAGGANAGAPPTAPSTAESPTGMFNAAPQKKPDMDSDDSPPQHQGHHQGPSSQSHQEHQPHTSLTGMHSGHQSASHHHQYPYL